MKIFVLVVVIVFMLLLMAPLVKQFFDLLLDRTVKFYLTKITFDGANIVFSQSKNTVMKQVTFKDVDAMGKSITATFSLAKDQAGNFPDLVEGSLRATSSNAAVASAAIGAVDKDAGTYSLVISYTGLKGSADCKLIASPDLDKSGDADIEGLVTSVITTEEASSFGEPVVSELQ